MKKLILLLIIALPVLINSESAFAKRKSEGSSAPRAYMSSKMKHIFRDDYSQVGIASWYGGFFHGRRTANGEIFNTYALTAAHKTLPFGTRLLVTNLVNGKEIIVKINDRGPFVGARILDLSYAAAKSIGMAHSGISRVRIEILPPHRKSPVKKYQTITAQGYCSKTKVMTGKDQDRQLISNAPHLRPVLTLALNSGMKRNEIVSLKWDNIDFENNMIVIGTGDRVKTVPMSVVFRSMLMGLSMENRIRSQYVFLGGNGQPLKYAKKTYVIACSCNQTKTVVAKSEDIKPTVKTPKSETAPNTLSISDIFSNSPIGVTEIGMLSSGNLVKDAFQRITLVDNVLATRL